MPEPSTSTPFQSFEAPRFVVITPVRNEAGYVGSTIASMVAQTILPKQWVIVNDGSTDGTGEILDAAARAHPWITVVHRPDRGYRDPDRGTVEAFYDGYSGLHDKEWDYIVKLDGDVSFEPAYFAQCLAHFAADPRLGIGGGAVHILENGSSRVESAGDPPFHVRGATKIYRSACWQQVHPLVPAPGFDTIDEVKANMHGWRTRTFADVVLLQHRETGAVNGQWRNCFKNGLANYVTGYHPLFMLAKCIRRLWRKPRLVAAAGLWAGFCSGYFKRPAHRCYASIVQYLRRQQMRCMLRRPSIYG